MGSIRHRRERTILVEQKFGSQTKSPLGKSGAALSAMDVPASVQRGVTISTRTFPPSAAECADDANARSFIRYRSHRRGVNMNADAHDLKKLDPTLDPFTN